MRQRPAPAKDKDKDKDKDEKSGKTDSTSGKKDKPQKIKTQRRQAEAEEFPWTRTDINFTIAKAEAKWDDSIYDAKAIEEMNAVRARNEPIIDDLDAKVQEQQRKAFNVS